MINKAIEKLTKEMMKMNDPFSQAIEEYLTGICTSDTVAAKILQEGKSLKGACGSIREAAAETPDPDKTKSALLQIVDALIGREA